ncbi:MAG: hypothetical protein KKG99_10255 [Bacteroidetes bacterium]|nr:hypothetical protein [Bacteroidota bacterium]
MKRLILVLMSLLMGGFAYSQNWSLKDIGVGIIVEDENYDKELKIMERGSVWDAKELYENGAQAGKYKGNQLFAAWIQGPHTDAYKNSYGVTVWLYKYKITYPDGKTFEAGPSGFYTPGFTYFGIKTGGYTTGNWKIEWFIWNRDTQETRLVGTSEFQTTYGKPTKQSVSGWQVKDIGIGIYDQTEYDKVLKIIKRGDTWSQKELYESGYLAGREKVFGTWIEGPPTSTYLNSYGTPIWSCKYVVTYPNGSKNEFGLYGFYSPGFNTLFINVGGNTFGKWKIEYYIWNRDTKETILIDTREFNLIQ